MEFWFSGRCGPRQRISRTTIPLLTAGLVAVLIACASGRIATPRATDEYREAADSRRAFIAVYDVLMHPRCLNCHPKGNRPLQGDDGRPHDQNVQRGEDGEGQFALKCVNCHQKANSPGRHLPPGAPDWRMPPADMPMVFEGRPPGVLCRQLQDEEQNGGMDLDDIMIHVELDDLVLWGWDPGDGRNPPPMDHAAFVETMRTWIRNGASCPE